MSRPFRHKLTTSYLMLIILILFTIMVILGLSIKRYYITDIQANLEQQARLIARMGYYKLSIAEDLTLSYQDIALNAADDTGTRVTIIDKKGNVIADSMLEPEDLGPHDSRPEVLQALHAGTGVAIRYSDSTKQDMIYVAVPLENNGIEGVVRLSRSLQDVQAIYYRLFLYVFAALLAVGIIAIIVSRNMSKNISHPIKELTHAVEDISAGNLKRRIAYHSDDELGALAGAVNDMASALDKNITEISRVKNRLETLLNNTVNGILMITNDARISYANPAALKILDFPDGYKGKKHVELISNYDLVEDIDQVRKTMIPVCREIKMLIPAEKHIMVNIVPVYGEEQDDAGGILVVLNDVSELKRLERMRSDFVSNVSHELKTPVASISGFAETLINETAENYENVKEFSRIIYNEAIRLSKLINRLLELSRIESGQSGLNIGNVDMVKLLADAADITIRNARENVEVSIIAPEEEVTVECDRDLICQVILNLLDNAVIYSPPGEAIRVILEADDENTVKVSVCDRGEGIPDNEITRVFERFYRIDKARSRKTGGTGLGLSIVKHLVENHNGTVGVDSEPGKGSRFYFILPRKQ